MEYAIIAVTVLFAAGLTFFSGFGLGTILLPVFGIFFDLPIAVGATAIVHFANNLFKFGFVYQHIHRSTLLWFGVPALLFATIGSLLLTYFSDLPPVHTYRLFGKAHEIDAVKLIIGTLMIFFAWFDIHPRFKHMRIHPKFIPLGGVLSGFFGGLSGHQGAFRATFLAKSELTKEQFIGTSNAISLVVDATRISIYIFVGDLISTQNKLSSALLDGKMLLITGITFAFIGTYFGNKLLDKTTIKGIQRLVGILLLTLGLAILLGLI